MHQREHYMREAIRLAAKGMRNNEGGPFGAVVVKEEIIIGRGNNRVIAGNDPTAHAEVIAIRDACRRLGQFQLTGCEIYTTCEPCPMCLGAIYWARPAKVYYACTRHDAAAIGFDDAFIYEEMEKSPAIRKIPFIQMSEEEIQQLFKEWKNKVDKKIY